MWDDLHYKKRYYVLIDVHRLLETTNFHGGTAFLKFGSNEFIIKSNNSELYGMLGGN